MQIFNFLTPAHREINHRDKNIYQKEVRRPLERHKNFLTLRFLQILAVGV